jgi:hypothetical protein
VEQRSAKRAETTRCTGTYSMECFIVKDNLPIARSGAVLGEYRIAESQA